jgi:hypothetical protein
MIFESCYVSIFIPKSKTDIYRDGNTVVISRMDSNLYPVKKFRKVFIVLNRNLSKCKDRFELRKENRPLYYIDIDEIP